MLKAARATFLQRFIIVNGESLEKKNIKSRFTRKKKSPNHASRKRNS